ncbi:MAG: DNA polymerase III subunit gamma/tau, partial [Pseudomonadota bacterium]
KLGEWTGQRWMVTVSGEPGQPTLKQQDEEAASAARRKALAHPTVQAVMEAFPGARLEAVRSFDDELDDQQVDSEPSDDEIADDL